MLPTLSVNMAKNVKHAIMCNMLTHMSICYGNIKQNCSEMLKTSQYSEGPMVPGIKISSFCSFPSHLCEYL